MLVSIITPVFNSEKTIGQVIESIKKQNYKNWEHIIVDNVSSDKTLDIVRELHADTASHLKIISEPDEGIADAFNKGMLAASGDILTILNSDDYFIPDTLLENVVQAFSKEAPDFVHGDIFFEDQVYGSNRRRPLECPIYESMPFNHPGLFIKKETFFKIGLFSKTYRYAMDYEWACRMFDNEGKLKYKAHYLQSSEPLVWMRGGGVSWVNEEKIIFDMLQALKEHHFDQFFPLTSLDRRLSRVRFKKILSALKLNFIVRWWRRAKWS